MNSSSEFSELYKKAQAGKSYSEEISLETIPEKSKIYTYKDFLQKLQTLVDEKKLSDIPILQIKQYMDMIEADDIDDFITQMIKERKNVVLYKNEKEEDILRVMLKSTHCPACITTNSKCQTCGINVCDLHSPDAEEAKSKRHCEACFKK